jgi:hypothetical protein
MARIRRSVIDKLLFLTASIYISFELFYFILNNTKHSSLEKIFSAGLTYIHLKNIRKSNYLQSDGVDQDIQPDLEEKSIAPQPERTYFSAGSLSEKPFILQDVDENILQNFAEIEFQKLILRLMINEYGDVEEVLIEEAKLSNELLSMLRLAFLKAKFSPGRIQGLAVPTILRIEVMLE